jgi:hypothetical protein
VNHFSLTHMMAVTLDTDQGPRNYTRQNLQVTNNSTLARFHKRESNGKLGQLWLEIDRTPRTAITSRFFKGSLYLSSGQSESVNHHSELDRQKVRFLNFDCSF